jgi:hypothetical protein
MKWLLVFLISLWVHCEAASLAEEEEFERAEAIFDPYYGGPLITPGAAIPDPGHFALQPYLFLNDTIGRYDDRGRRHPIPHIHAVNPFLLAFAGIAKRVGLQFAGGYVWNWQSGNRASGWTDPSLTLLLPIVKEDPDRPAIMLAVRQAFPGGRYQNLNPNRGGLDGQGSGAYITSLWLNFAKLILAFPNHPMRFRISNQFAFPSSANVRELNSFGGGSGTRGTVELASSYRLDSGYEYSFTQRWVGVIDFIYIYAGPTSFFGCPGVDADGCRANVGTLRFQQLSLAPGLQYNFSKVCGLLAGVWFTFWGRNAPQFVSGVITGYIKW